MSVAKENQTPGTANLRKQAPYRGRFAPTPSGPLHFGSIIAALGSYLQAKSQNGTWLVRIEDIDTPRNQPGATTSILNTLERLGLYWDETVLIQSERLKIYEEILKQLNQQQLLYSCTCSRAWTKGTPYPGTCRNGIKSGNKATALRLRTTAESVSVNDQIQDTFSQTIETDVGDFILRRSDGIIAYHLAVVVDDHLQGITEIVRGSDLLDSTPRQIYLQRLLGYSTPEYSHLPIAANPDGSKISKQNHAPGVDAWNDATLLCRALEFLGQSPEGALQEARTDEILRWATAHWNPVNVPRQAAITAA